MPSTIPAIVTPASGANVWGEFPAQSSFAGSEVDLGERVERLLAEQRHQGAGRTGLTGRLTSRLGAACAAMLVAAAMVATTRADVLYGVHRVMERLVH